MLYHNVFVPHYVPAIYVPPSKIRKKKKKKTKFSLYAVPYKKKRYSFAYYLKYVLWKKLRRLWKKRKTRGKKKKPHKPSSISVLSNKGSDEKIDLRDFWGSKYGSQWLFAKQKQQQQQQQVNRHHIIEIVDAFKTKDLKYANRHSGQRSKDASSHHALPGNTSRKSVGQSSRKSSKCPCCRRSRQKEWGDNDSSDWSLSTVRCQQRPYSKWPPHIPPGAKHLCGKEEQFTTILSRQHAYLYNWLNVDQSQSRCKLTMSKEYLDKVRMRIDGSRPSSRRRGSSGSQVSCSCSESGSCSSTLSRRERAKILKRQRKAKEKASILWLLSKAFGGRIPSDLKEPFYRDHDNVRRLKPKIVHSLANAELYCLALVNIYSDPNYNNLDHQGIIQALMRKGICLVESREAPLTETTLVQTAPIRLNAHLSVIDGIMCLFIKEVLIPEKIVEVCRQFSAVDVNSEMPSNAEEAAVLWINKCCKTLEKEIRSESSPEEEKKLPKIPVLQEVADISDGCCLAAVISYYCPNYLRWHDIVWNDPMSLGDSIHNLQLIKKFCCESLPCEINFLTLEDLLYLHPSIKENVLAFVSDLLFMFVITKVSCVSRKKEIVPKEPSRIPLENSKSLSNFPSHKSQALCSPIPNLRSDSYGGSTSSLPDIRPGSRTRTFGSKEKLIEKVNIKKSNLSSDELGPNQLQRTNSVGVVNGWKTPNLPYVGSTDSVSGSPRHTNSEMSRPTVEGESASSNFSQPSVSTEDINAAKHSHFLRNNFVALNSPQREQVYGLRKNSEGFLSSGDNNVINSDLRKGRKSLEDYYNQLAGVDGPLRSVSASNITENKGWRNCEKFSPKSHGGESVPESASSQSSGICCDVDSKHNFSTTSFAQLSKLKDSSSSSINIVYMNQDRDGQHSTNSPSTPVKKFEVESKKTTFASLPNTTTWQQQHAASSTSNFPQTDSGHETPTEPADNMLNAQLCNIKLKLEEKKRKIELKKKRMELLWKKQRQKLGQAAFLQAVSKNPKAEAGTPDSGTGKEVGEVEFPSVSLPVIKSSVTLVKRMSMQDIAEDLDVMQKKWLNQTDATEQLSLPDTNDLSLDVGVSIDDTLNIDLQTSIEHLNTSLTDLQADISRISLQQEQVENLMKDSIDDASHFFLHGQSPNNSQFNSSPSKGPLHWQFNDSSFSFSKGGYSELDSKDFSSFLSSPQHPESNSQFSNQFKMSSFASLPPCPPANKPKVAEELYSKVIKPENRQKVQSNTRTTASSSCKVPPSKPVGSSEVSSKPVQPKKSTEIHIVLPQVPDNKCGDASTGKKTKDVLYIPIEKEVKKTKSKTLKSVKPASDILSVPNSVNVPKEVSEDTSVIGFVIGADLVHPDPETETEMARKKEMIMNLSIQRKADYERRRAQKEQEYAKLKEEEQRKQEYLEKKREEEKKRRESILEQYRQRKIQEELEKEGILPHKETSKFTKHRASVYQVKKNDNRLSMNFTKPVVELRNQLTSLKQNSNRKEGRPRPRSAYVPMNSDLSSLISMDNAANKRNSHVFQGRELQEFDLDSLNSASTSASSHDRPRSPSNSFPHHRNANLQIPEGSNPSSDGASDTASNGSSAAAIDYTGPKLFVKPAAKSNRGIIVNAINTVLAGAVNNETKKKVVEEINKSDSKHFLILFRDAGCQFRALYTYNPEREEVIKLYGIGPKNVTDKMMNRFYKYNSGGKCFSEIQTKHLTVTIDAFTIPNSLWAGKKVIPPRKEFF